MSPELEIQIGKAIYHTLKSARSGDVIDISEKICAAVVLTIDMNSEDSGIADVSADTAQTVAWNIREMRQEAEERRVPRAPMPPKASIDMRGPAVPPKADRVIVLPGDEEFNEVTKAAEVKSGPITPVKARRVAPGKPASNSAEKEYWTPYDLGKAIEDNTPPRLDWYTKDPDDNPVPVYALRNVVQKIGMGIVELTYKYPGVAEPTSNSSAGTPISISDLTARVQFSVYKEEVDIESAMELIKQQLTTLYSYKGKHIEPRVGPEPPPLSQSGMTFDRRSMPMGSSFESRFTPGAAIVHDPHGTIKAGVFQENWDATPKQRR